MFATNYLDVDMITLGRDHSCFVKTITLRSRKLIKMYRNSLKNATIAAKQHFQVNQVDK